MTYYVVRFYPVFMQKNFKKEKGKNKNWQLLKWNRPSMPNQLRIRRNRPVVQSHRACGLHLGKPNQRLLGVNRTQMHCGECGPDRTGPWLDNLSLPHLFPLSSRPGERSSTTALRKLSSKIASPVLVGSPVRSLVKVTPRRCC